MWDAILDFIQSLFEDHDMDFDPDDVEHLSHLDKSSMIHHVNDFLAENNLADHQIDTNNVNLPEVQFGLYGSCNDCACPGFTGTMSDLVCRLCGHSYYRHG